METLQIVDPKSVTSLVQDVLTGKLPPASPAKTDLRLNLGCGNDIRHGYVNVDRNTNNSPLITRGDFRDLQSAKIQDNSVVEIVANDIIQYISIKELRDVVTNWHKKLKQGGTLHIQSIDYSYLGNEMSFEHISTDEVNELLFGDQNNPLRGLYNLTGMETFLTKLGFATVEKGYLDRVFFIRVEKL